MDKKQLLESAISATMTKEMVADIVSLSRKQGFDILDLYGFCFYPQPAMAFRAAWIMECIALDQPELFAPVLPLFLSQLGKQKNLSCQRHFSKILLFVIARQAPDSYRNALKATDREELVSVVFDWLVLDQTPIAVKANCMEILAYFCREFVWIREELRLTLEQLMDRGDSPALFSRGKRVLAMLRNSSNK